MNVVTYHRLLRATLIALLLAPGGVLSLTTGRQARRVKQRHHSERLCRAAHVPTATPRADTAPPADSARRRVMAWVAAGVLSVPPFSARAATSFERVARLTEDQAEERLRAGRQSIQYLLDHFDEIVAAGGGDNVRRYLGTVGMTSGLVQIDKTLQALEDRADDFVEYTETRNDVVQAIQQADGSAYMAIFVSTSPSETPPEKYFNDSKIEVRNCIKAMDRLAELIDFKY